MFIIRKLEHFHADDVSQALMGMFKKQTAIGCDDPSYDDDYNVTGHPYEHFCKAPRADVAFLFLGFVALMIAVGLMILKKRRDGKVSPRGHTVEL